MARAKPRADATARADYEQDFFAWTQEQAQILRARGARGLDWEHLAEEIEAMGRRDRRELESRLRRILHHLLKWQVQPELRGPSWRNTLVEQRRQADKLLRDSPSLRAHLAALRDEAWPDAVRDAVADTGLPPRTFPAACPFTLDQILDQDYLPADDA